MAKKGAALEQLVALIQETLKDRQDTTVQINVKVSDNTGMCREIDVLVSTIVQGLPYVIAFECKDYSKKPVDVQVVDSFIGKCKYLPSLHRKVIVSTSGFSENAIKRAQNEDIVLCSLDQLPLDKLFSDTKVYNPTPKYELGDRVVFTFVCPDKDVDENYFDSNECYRVADDSVYDVRLEALKELCRMPNMMRLVKRFMEGGRKPFNSTMTFHCEPNYLYLKNKKGEKCFVQEIQVPFIVNFDIQEGYVVKQQKLTQGKDVFITENKFENRPYSAVIIESGDKHSASFKINDQYIKPSIRL